MSANLAVNALLSVKENKISSLDLLEDCLSLVHNCRMRTLKEREKHYAIAVSFKLFSHCVTKLKTKHSFIFFLYDFRWQNGGRKQD
jgi:hypothetical protein